LFLEQAKAKLEAGHAEAGGAGAEGAGGAGKAVCKTCGRPW